MEYSLKNAFARLPSFLGKNALVWLCLGIVGSVSLVIFELCIASFLQLFLKTLGVLPKELKVIGLFSNISPSLGALIAILIVLSGIRALAQFVNVHSGIAAQEWVRERLSQIMAYDILMSPKPHHGSPARYAHLVGTSFFQTAQFCCMFAQLISGVVQSIGLCFALLYLAPKEAVLSLFGLGVLGLVWWMVFRRIRHQVRRVPVAQNALMEGIQRVVSQITLIKILKKNAWERHHLGVHMRHVAHNTMLTLGWSHALMTATPFLGVGLIVIVLFFSLTFFGTQGTILLSFFYMFIRFVQGLSVFVNCIGQAVVYWPHFRESYGYFLSFSPQILEEVFQIPKPPHARIFPSLSPSETGDQNGVISHTENIPNIVCYNMGFSFDGRQIIKNLSFKINAGSQFGIVGPSGSGKSTLLNLILGSLTPQLGTLVIEGIPPEKYVKKYNVGYVGAEPFLIRGTVADNLNYGPYVYTEDQMWEALEHAQLAHDVRNLPKGLNHPLDENGSGFSLGQRQRLCLARAFIYRPKLLILDEITANLDSSTEKQIVQQLALWKGKATVILVSHRKATLEYCDSVLNLEQQ